MSIDTDANQLRIAALRGLGTVSVFGGRWSGSNSIELSYSSAVPIQPAVSELGRFRVTHVRAP